MKYRICGRLGDGTKGANVYSAQRVSDGRRAVVKVVNKRDKEDHFLRLVQGIPGVVQLYATERIDADKVALVMESCEMDLHDFLRQQRRGLLHEQSAKILFKQILYVVMAITNHGVMHGDIKLENLLIDTRTLRIKLCDFGSAEMIKDGAYLNKNDGTSLYRPPEWHEFKVLFSPSATVWALGVCLYSMVHKDCPFQTADQIKRLKLDISDEISPQLRSLIKTCLALAPAARPTLLQIVKHPWML